MQLHGMAINALDNEFFCISFSLLAGRRCILEIAGQDHQSLGCRAGCLRHRTVVVQPEAAAGHEDATLLESCRRYTQPYS